MQGRQDQNSNLYAFHSLHIALCFHILSARDFLQCLKKYLDPFIGYAGLLIVDEFWAMSFLLETLWSEITKGSVTDSHFPLEGK